MLDPLELLTETLIPVLRSMPELLATVANDENNISAHVHSYPDCVEAVFQVIARQDPGTILVTHRSTNIGGVNGNGIEHNYSLCLRPIGTIGPMFVALRDGIPALVRTADGLVAGSGSKFKFSQIHYKCRPPLATALNLQSLLITDQQFIEYYEVPLVLAERGLDN